MAEDKKQNITSTTTETFIKGLNKDSDATFIQEGMWAHARNAVNNTLEGDLGTLSNEASNTLCTRVLVNAPVQPTDIKKIIGAIHLFADKWVIFSSVNNGLNPSESLYSEIGLFEEDLCSYRVISEQKDCLNFSMFHLITGAARLQEDCSWGIYFADGNNPDRYLNIGDPKDWPTGDYLGNNYYDGNVLWPGSQWEEKCFVNTEVDDEDCYEPGQGCLDCTQLNRLDCDKIRLARLMRTPCLKVFPGQMGGQLPNGSYMAMIAYSIKNQKVTDWFSPSNIQPLWFEEEPLGSIDISVEADKVNFDEFILCIVSVVNQKTVAKQIGVYPTSVEKITIDFIDASLPSIPVEQLPIQTPVYEKSDQIVEVNNYLLRVAPTSKFDFNYQPLANLIDTKWVSVEYDADYYVKQGYKPSYLRDEVYSFFIRWIYDTGDKSASYHIPGRPSELFTNPCNQQEVKECELISFAANNPNVINSNGEKTFEVFNTAQVIPTSSSELEDGGIVIAEGKMGYHESTEIYPANQPDVWNSSSQCWTGTTDNKYDLCGRPIRHHKFPEQSTGPEVHHFVNNNGNLKIRLLGVKFKNIILPKDNDGNDIPGIVGYEILRGSREGNRSIIAKGMLNNMRPFNLIRNNSTLVSKGLYPNYPFNTITPINPVANSAASGILNAITGGVNSNINDPYIINVELQQSTGIFNPTQLNPKTLVKSDMPKNILTFHSPDTSFRKPFLEAPELKIYGYLKGQSSQEFVYPDGHPRHKLMTNGILVAMIVGGVVNAIIQAVGKRTINGPKIDGPFFTGGDATAGAQGLAYAATLIPPPGVLATWNTFLRNYKGSAVITDTYFNPAGSGSTYQSQETLIRGLISTLATAGLANPYTVQYTSEGGINNYFGGPLRTATALQRFYFSFSEGANNTVEIIKNIVPFRQYALQMQAHGFYDEFETISCEHKTRFIINNGLYLKQNSNQSLKPDSNGTQYIVNNLLRQQTIVLTTKTLNSNSEGPNFIEDIESNDADQSLITVGTSGIDKDVWSSLQEGNGSGEINKTISSHYGALKLQFRNQYGQIDSVRQVPVTECEQKIDFTNLDEAVVDCNGVDITQRIIEETPVFFGGDTYINRYTEKNNMFFFNTWLYNLPDGTIINYFLNQQIPQVRFWANTQPYDVSNLLGSGGTGIINDLIDFISPGATNFTGDGSLPRRFYRLDNPNYNYTFNQVFSPFNPITYPGLLSVRRSFFYTAVSSIRDFFVESEVIVDHREQKELPFQKHYNPYGFNNLKELLNMNPDWITRGNAYLYDYSLSVTKLFTQYFSQGATQSRFYDPRVSSQCYTYQPDRIIYSLPQQQESVKDAWFTYLANNYKNFQDEISGVKNFAKTGIFITFKNASPLMLQGVDELQTDLGAKITIGDGGLFARQPQNVVIADRPYEHGSSNSRLSIISTPAGMFYASENQGKIFTYNQGIQEISNKGMKWWFNNFLPFKLLEDFPDYPHTDNPVAGVGVHASYNSDDAILYFSKRDFRLRERYKGLLDYNPNVDFFILNNVEQSPIIHLGDPEYFEDASWTVSYDPKNQYWISFHDWHPNMFLPSRNKFFTAKEDGIWEHGKGCEGYCEFYGVNYPFEIEVPVTTGQQVNSIRSLEYILECYRRNIDNCIDQFHVLDFNFDHAVIYNTEQVSGILELIPYPKNNPFAAQQYPQFVLAPARYQVLFAKEENKYRVNQFWDITNDRGEFTPTEELIWITESNGYKKALNPVNLDYQKAPQERKKFRHYANFLHLRRDVSGNTNMILKIINTKKTYSPR
jgi:hypothetical protein